MKWPQPMGNAQAGGWEAGKWTRRKAACWCALGQDVSLPDARRSHGRFVRRALEEAGVDRDVGCGETGCVGACDLGAAVVVARDGTFYQRVTPWDVPDIVESHLRAGRPVERLFHRSSATGVPEAKLEDIQF